MNTIMNPHHFHPSSPPRLSPPRMGGRKRKADDYGRPDDTGYPEDEQMNTSPSHSPNAYTRPTHSHSRIKRQRNNVSGRPLALSRLLETVDVNALKSILQVMCDRHPELTAEVSSLVPRPTVSSALSTLNNYEASVRSAFPYGGNSTGDYAYNRVRPALMQLLDALSDYTPHFLPPNEAQASTSLAFLDEATNIIHRLPTWDNPVHNHSKNMAYEEIAKAWVLVVQEAAKRGAGIGLHTGGWDTKLGKHVEQSEGRMQAALTQMRQSVGWMGDSVNGQRRLGGLGFNMHSTGVQVPVRSW